MAVEGETVAPRVDGIGDKAGLGECEGETSASLVSTKRATGGSYGTVLVRRISRGSAMTMAEVVATVAAVGDGDGDGATA